MRPGTLIATAGAAQVLLLAVLGTVAGLGPAGLVVGVAHAAILLLLLGRGLRRAGGGRPGGPGTGRRPASRAGPADLVTTARAVLGGGVTALVADGLTRPEPPVAVAALVGLAAVALTLDAVDGRVARRTGTATAFGSRFDMEADAYLVLVLSVRAATVLDVWVLVIGIMRYAFVAAGWVLPWLRGPLPPSFAAKAVAAVQGIVLLVVCAEVLPGPVATAAAAVAAGLLVWSFGRSVAHLRRAAAREPA